MRKIFFSKSRLQRRYLRLITLAVIFPTAIIGGCLYYIIFTLLAQHIAIPEFIAETLFPVVKKVNLILLLAMPVATLLIFWEGIVVSHRLAGPIDRMKRDLDDITETGDYSKRLVLREGDVLKPVADDINELLDKLGGQH